VVRGCCMVLFSKCISHVLAWTPLIASLYTWLFFKYWSKPDYGLASILLNDKVAPVVVGALISALCLFLSLFRDFFLERRELYWYDHVGRWCQIFFITAGGLVYVFFIRVI